jgi:nucleotide-binding universal stress UspA family protein
MATASLSDPIVARPAAATGPPAFAHVVCLAALSPEGAVAEAHAALLATAPETRLTIYHVLDPVLACFTDTSMQANSLGSAAERLARATLEGQAAFRGVARARRCVVIDRDRPTAASMAAGVRRLHGDVAVMAPQARGALSRALGFSLTEATVDGFHGEIPVLCARGDARPYRRILVATDFSAGSRRALRLSARLASSFGARITVIHAVADEVGEPCAAILQARDAVDADLIVLSTRGRDNLRDAIVGTHAQRVIRRAPCPVLVC